MRAALLCVLTTLILSAAEKPRVIVLTDISNEPDDEQSLVRLLVYANEFDIEGLIATTSVWLRDKTRPDLIRRQVDAYAQVYPNLRTHAAGYPEPGKLRAVVKNGSAEFGMAGVGERKSTEGSRHIIDVVDNPDPRPVWVAAWGGSNTLAQALWEVKYSRSTEELKRFVSKLRVYTISDQDNAGRWLRITFPDLFYVVSPSSVDEKEYYLATWTGISGDRFYKNGPLEHFELVDNPWLERNVMQGHGALGALYPKLAYIMEGDTPSFLNLIGNGLEGHVDASYGGWGGRYELRQSYGETRPIYTNSRDTVTLKNGTQHTSNSATVWRWREAFQHDFAARMDWCVKTRSDANHNPIAVVNGTAGREIVRMRAKAGDTVKLSASGSKDPDGNAISYRWFHYREAGTHAADLKFTGAESESAEFVVPKAQKPGTIHVILELRDNGEPSLFSYRRVIVEVEDEGVRAQALYLEKMLRSAPDRSMVSFLIARTWASASHWGEAHIWLRRTLESDPGLDPSRDAAFKSMPGLADYRQLVDRATPRVQRSRLAFQIAEADLVPESLAYDPAGRHFYFGSIHKGKVVRCSPAGDCTDFASGLDSILGIKVHDASLWLVSNAKTGSALIHFDLQSGKLVAKYALPGGHMLNDLAISPEEDVFVTDSVSGAVWELPKGAKVLSRLPERFASANGIALSSEGRLLYVSCFPDGVRVFDLQSRAGKAIRRAGDWCLGSIDGLYFHEGTLIAIQNGWMNPRVVRLRLDADLRGIETLEVLEQRHPDYHGVTTGVVTGNELFYMANIQDDKQTDFQPILILGLAL